MTLLRTGGDAINSGAACPSGYSSKTFIWGTGSDQVDCSTKFPNADSTYSSGNCITTFLYPATEIMQDDKGNDNGLCESGEECLHNPNSGAYAGHGNLVDSSCDVSGIISGITLKIYESNGY
ncbi:MAG: hypothetical protein AAF487_04380 [Bacteroidota bacterium]